MNKCSYLKVCIKLCSSNQKIIRRLQKTIIIKVKITTFSSKFQVYRTPIPVEDMILEDLHPAQGLGSSFSDSSSTVALNATANGGAKHGSFRSAFGSSSSNAGQSVLLEFSIVFYSSSCLPPTYIL